MKKVISIILALVLSLSMLAFASTPVEQISLPESIAQDLKSLNLFKGVSETDFDLYRAPTRIEALVMLIRVLGQEEAALSGTWSHPFTDVPAWADKYVGYAYSKGLTKGISSNEFGSRNANSAMYFTFVLRALGYSDTNGKDFTWNNPYELAKNTQIYSTNVDIENFMRKDVATVSYAALSSCLKDSSTTLAHKLINAGVFSWEEFYSTYDTLKVTSPQKTYTLNSRLRDFIIENGQAETLSGFGIITQIYTLSFHNQDHTYRYDLNYTPETGVLYASEAYTGGSSIDKFSTTLYFAGLGTESDYSKVVVNVNDNGTQIIASSFISPNSYTYLEPIEFDVWTPVQINSDVYTRESCANIAGGMLSDVIDTTELVFAEFDIGFSIVNFGFTSFFE
ncbi:MAG: S-layer homology domain-containing protein [Oscillospiraceae bacterium]|nr:S-layer homology domain-containing protein [Oscillospiraceae bacterium]